MPDYQLQLKIPRELMLHFKAGCIKRDTSANKTIIRLMRRQLEDWGEPSPSTIEVAAVAEKETARV